MGRVFMDPDAVSEAATKYDHLADDLDQRAAAIAEILAGECRSSSVPAKARAAAELFRAMAADMRSRVDVIRQADAGGWGGTFETLFITMGLPWEETYFPERGAALAQRFNDLDRSDEAAGREFHAIATELDRHQGHGGFATEFYTNLDPRRVGVIPSLLADTASDTARRDLEAFSRALGTALSTSDPSLPLQRIMDDFTDPPRHLGEAWNRGALLAHGRFPPEWLTRVARVNVLDDLSAAMNDDLRGTNPAATRALGLPEDTVALYLGALGHHPSAARDALTHMGEPDHARSRPDNIGRLLAYANARNTSEVAPALGRALEAGAGATDEQPGKHSPEATRFALDAIVGAGDASQVPLPARGSMAAIAVAYPHEIVSGARVDISDHRRSGMENPLDWVNIVGIDPAFYLSPRDTYEFLETFASHDEFTDVFDTTMGKLHHQVLTEATVYDVEAMRLGDPDPEQFQNAAGMFGDLAGLEYQAQLKVRGGMDAADKRTRAVVATVLTAGVNQVPTPAGLAARAAWMATRYAAVQGIKSFRAGRPEVTRAGQVEATRDQMVLTVRFHMAATLHDAGYPADPPPPPHLLDPATGRLRPYHEVAADPVLLKDFADWCNSTAAYGPDDPVPASGRTDLRDPGGLDSKVELAADAMATSDTQTSAEGWG